MSTKNESLKVVIITLFSVFFLEAFLCIVYKFIGQYLIAGDWYVNYREFIELPVCLIVIIYLVKSKGNVLREQNGKGNRRKWLYVFPVIFFMAAMIHRVLFLKNNVLVEYLRPLQRSVSDIGYITDYSNLLREGAVLLLMLFIINPLMLETKKKQKNQTGKCAFIAGTLFIVLAVWILYRSIFIGIRLISTGMLRLGWNTMMAQYAVLLCGYCMLAAALFKGKRRLLIIGSCAVLLYDVIYFIDFPQYAWKGFFEDFSRFLGYVVIVVLSIVTLVLEKKGNRLKSKLLFIFPIVFLVGCLFLNIPAILTGAYSFILDYECIVHDVAIFFTMLWVIYPDGLPEWKRGKRI